jgi:hypothetical protein
VWIEAAVATDPTRYISFAFCVYTPVPSTPALNTKNAVHYLYQLILTVIFTRKKIEIFIAPSRTISIHCSKQNKGTTTQDPQAEEHVYTYI